MEIPIHVRETQGLARKGEPVRIGVPIPKGELQDLCCISLLDMDGNRVPYDARPLGRWGDGSIKWLLIDFDVTVQASSQKSYRLCRSTSRNEGLQSKIRIQPGEKEWVISNGDAVFSVPTDTFRPFAQVSVRNRPQLSRSSTVGIGMANGSVGEAFIDTIRVEEEGALRSTILFSGVAGDTREQAVFNFHSRLYFFAGSPAVYLEFVLRNPNAAQHRNGLWDLGDPGSCYLSHLALELPLHKPMRIICSPDAASGAVISEGNVPEPLQVFQHSSGGEHWDSPVHLTGKGVIPHQVSGAILLMGSQKKRFSRPTPIMWCGDGTAGTAVVRPYFWQNFPAALYGDASGLRLEFLPPLPCHLHELQGGEQKTFSAWFSFGASPSSLDWTRAPVEVHVDPKACRESAVLPDLPYAPAGQDLLDAFVSGPEDILAKREIVDEYGWRNFGDVYADHEAINREPGAIFVSHYNNQYDICAGFYRKFLATGGSEWRVLAEDLARHVADIDIYRTEVDREEYNHGMFWHTDHYLPAGGATHRSFSESHVSLKQRACGGGPGAEHCYTSGLLLHYFLTGHPDFREAVIKLADWSIRALKGPQTILSSFRKGSRYLRYCRNRSKAGPVAFPRFPLTRGTGNTIVACLDAFAAGGGKRYLDSARDLLQGAIHPDDDIAARNLGDAETAWSYTVLLAAVAKYLDVKADLDEIDRDFAYGRKAIIAYGEWMLRNEYLYLDRPEILEFPNETWAAQELRKAVVLYHAGRFAEPADQARFFEKALYFYSSAKDQLLQHHTSTFTRPLALMLQNGWVGAKLSEGPPPSCYPGGTFSFTDFGSPTPVLSVATAIRRFGEDFFCSLMHTNLKKEYRWLRSRLG